MSLFDRWDLETTALAKALLGQTLVRVSKGRRLAGRIVETEAYLGGKDLGSHSAGGRRTPRNESMFLPGGHAYVYFVYGMHHCFNVVSGPEGVGCAVLIRAIEPLEGIEWMAANRGLESSTGRGASPGDRAATRFLRAIGAGPARLCEALRIDRGLDGEALGASARLFIEPAAVTRSTRIERGPRIGIHYAGEWTEAPLRFAIAGSPFVSRPFITRD